MEAAVDVLVIGAGAVGCAIARELSRYRLRVAVVEKNPDVAGEASGRNSAVAHAGFNNKPGSLMARLCVEGNQGFEAVCAELDVPYRKTGKYLVAFNQADQRVLRNLLEQGEKNGCKGLTLLSGEQLRKVLPQIDGVGAMYSPETAIFDPCNSGRPNFSYPLSNQQCRTRRGGYLCYGGSSWLLGVSLPWRVLYIGHHCGCVSSSAGVSCAAVWDWGIGRSSNAYDSW